ncbi:PaaI family thioesterase [Thermoproteus tenax]|uniref:PaaI family thioesterase n=1 Tax=Thermoproteus tenax (strain ATCC 35583 / DSM 2078 / JCM 9277 / NBRC 100435 / Kra 1) TaxID=768679 RepID=G4RN87_THETK|nr:PaaI family thioesterase [Thermoproteus tenax]CCC81031.1 PaaI family thioesterase [Thermoproteus tenax Kra 1]
MTSWGRGLPLEPAAITEVVRRGEPILALIHYEVVEIGDGNACAVFQHTPYAVRIGGVLHGGVIAAALDETLGVAVLTVNHGADQVTVELKINYLEPGRVGPYRVCGQVVRRGSRIVVAEGEVRDANGVVIAKALGTWYILSKAIS